MIIWNHEVIEKMKSSSESTYLLSRKSNIVVAMDIVYLLQEHSGAVENHLISF